MGRLTMLKVYIGTNGCVEAQLSSTHVEQFFKKNEVDVTSNLSQADLVLFYTCGLTEQREKDTLSIIRDIKTQMKPTARLIVWGCLPKINPQALSPIYNGPLIGPHDTSFFEELLEKPAISFQSIERGCPATMLTTVTSDSCEPCSLDPFSNVVLYVKNNWYRLRSRARKATNFFIRTATGCTGSCTYCSERCVFGRVKSRPIEDIVADFKWGLEQGYNQFSLIATDLGAYGQDRGLTLYDLLNKMIKCAPEKNYKLILNQVNPSCLKRQLSQLEEIFASGKVESLNCPVQAGSNRLLKLMSRNYTVDEWKDCMIKLDQNFPSIKLTTHLMVGFPTETDEDFKKTLKLLDYPPLLHNIFLFKFSSRPGVYASRMPEQVPEKVKELRCKKLLQTHVRKYAINVAIKYTHLLF